MSIRKRLLGYNHPETAHTLNNLGFWYKAAGENDEALEYYNQSLAVVTHVFGLDHLQTAFNRRNVALAFCLLDNADFAAYLLKQVEPIFTCFLGPNHVETIAKRQKLQALTSTQAPLST